MASSHQTPGVGKSVVFLGVGKKVHPHREVLSFPDLKLEMNRFKYGEGTYSSTGRIFVRRRTCSHPPAFAEFKDCSYAYPLR